MPARSRTRSIASKPAARASSSDRVGLALAVLEREERRVAAATSRADHVEAVGAAEERPRGS